MQPNLYVLSSSPQLGFSQKVSRGSFQFFPPFHRSTEVSTHFLIVFHPLTGIKIVKYAAIRDYAMHWKMKYVNDISGNILFIKPWKVNSIPGAIKNFYIIEGSLTVLKVIPAIL